jgi:hypothetical protein
MTHGHGRRPDPAKAEGCGYEETYAQTVRLVSAVTDADLDRVVDTRWTPPVTLGVRLVSVLNDDMMHAGQATYAHGIVLRAR